MWFNKNMNSKLLRKLKKEQKHIRRKLSYNCRGMGKTNMQTAYLVRYIAYESFKELCAKNVKEYTLEEAHDWINEFCSQN